MIRAVARPNRPSRSNLAEALQKRIHARALGNERVEIKISTDLQTLRRHYKPRPGIRRGAHFTGLQWLQSLVDFVPIDGAHTSDY